MRVGSKSIDDEHKYLFSLVNCVLLSIKLGDIKLVEEFIDQFIDYCVEHFESEERLQVKINYPHMTENQREHQKILKDLTQVKEIIHRENLLATQNDVDGEESKIVLDDIAKLIRHWILEHVLKTDLKMQEYIMALPKEKRPR